MKNKLQLNWKKALIFLFCSGGLIILTGSFWMSLGFMLLLFAIDGVLANWEQRRKTKKFFEELKKSQEEKDDADHVHD